VADPRDDEPVLILREHGHALLAASLAAEINAPDKQRGGVYGTAEQILAFLTNRHALAWVTPGPGRVEFHPHEFVRGRGTLNSLSKEGKGSAAPWSPAPPSPSPRRPRSWPSGPPPAACRCR
jgi:hypothetical protein